MVGGAADHRIDVLLVEAFPPVHVLLRPGELLRPKGEVLFVYVADRDDVLAGKTVEMGFGPAPRAEEGDVQLVAGSIGAEEFGPRKDEPGGPGESDGSEELTSFHAASLATERCQVKRSNGVME